MLNVKNEVTHSDDIEIFLIFRRSNKLLHVVLLGLGAVGHPLWQIPQEIGRGTGLGDAPRISLLHGQISLGRWLTLGRL